MSAEKTISRESKKPTQQELKRRTIANRIADQLNCSAASRPLVFTVVYRELENWLLARAPKKSGGK